MIRTKTFGLAFATLALAATLALPAAAQDTQALRIATGKTDATNSQMFQAIKAACPANLQEITDTSGGADNIGLLQANKVDAGIAQVDVAEFLQKTDPNIGKLRSLVALNPNYLHIIASTRGVMVDPGKPAAIMGFGGTPARYAQVSNINDLKGQTVVAHGSAQLTIRIISQKLGLNLSVVDDDTKDRQGLQSVKNGQAAAFVAMGGRPVGWIEQLNGADYVLVPMQKEAVGMLGSPYSAQQLTYKNLSAFGFYTAAVKNELFVRNFQGGKAKLLADLRECYKNNLIDIKETTGTHAAWQEVDDLDATAWPRFEAPAATPAQKQSDSSTGTGTGTGATPGTITTVDTAAKPDAPARGKTAQPARK